MTVPVFLYGDYGCPFTYVEDARLAILASEGAVRVTWRPLPSDAGPTAESAAAAGDPGDPGGLDHAAAELGLSLFIPDHRPDTRAAAQAAEFARDCGEDDFRRLHAALFRAVFVEGRDVGDEATLLDVAEGVGIDREGLSAALADGRYAEVLTEVEGEAERYGVEGTPTMLVGRYKIVGAAPFNVLRETVARAADS